MAYTTVNCHLRDDTAIEARVLIYAADLWTLKIDVDMTIFGTPDQLRVLADTIIDALPDAPAEEVVA